MVYVILLNIISVRSNSTQLSTTKNMIHGCTRYDDTIGNDIDRIIKYNFYIKYAHIKYIFLYKNNQILVYVIIMNIVNNRVNSIRYRQS